MSIHPIRHLVILAHPERGSFNHQIATAYCETVEACGQEVCFRDLYMNRFDPILEYAGGAPALNVVTDLLEVERCDVLVFIYPIWFGMPPAMIKGYVDRVLGAGFKPTKDHPRAHSTFLQGRHMLSFSTSASTEAWLAEQGQLITLREGFDGYLKTIFELAEAEHVHFDAIVEGLSKQYAEEILERVRKKARETCATVLNVARRDEMSRVLTGKSSAASALAE